ncbi:hypothetical protein PSQ39_21250 [Curvibacter sp. HBC28]|uniref:Uncharacterized protein n=1 Tax=Curvibacter microcysteis TaxID=3026419 RepID=A0ABT5MKQ4_9BURK|nr:hypothetical protein [Curvibacter sp. HBC28]MDD0817175.1 hypothetical protein [Curvibacter sp. HBC28]
MRDQVPRQEFDHKTAGALLDGRKVSDEAIRSFVAASRAAHDDRESLRGVLQVVLEEVATRDAEIKLLKEALLKAEEDAERYRWLRGRSAWTLISANGITRLAHRLPVSFTPIEQNADDYDAAIDAARAAKGGADG